MRIGGSGDPLASENGKVSAHGPRRQLRKNWSIPLRCSHVLPRAVRATSSTNISSTQHKSHKGRSPWYGPNSATKSSHLSHRNK
eukprot:6842979-Alexandrium_andersonii.AAC.1